MRLRACLETTRGAVFGEKAGWRGATKENIPGGSSTEEQRSQTAFSPKTLRAAGLLSVAGVGSFLTARCGDARNSPPWPQPKSLAAAPLVVSKQALRRREARGANFFAEFEPRQEARASSRRTARLGRFFGLQETFKVLNPRRMPQLAERFGLDLADALAGHLILFADLVERSEER